MANYYIYGETTSVYIRDYVKIVFKDTESSDRVYLMDEPNDYDEYKKENVAFVFDKKEKGFLKSIIQGLRLTFSKSYKSSKPDVFIIHFVNPMVIFRYYILWKRAKKRILVFWGSDVNDTLPYRRFLLKYLPKSVTDMVFIKDELRNNFENFAGKKYEEKIRIVDFGMPMLSTLNEYIGFEFSNKDKIRKDNREEFGIPQDKICIHIGYNAQPRQHHLDVIKELQLLPVELKERIYIVIPYSYGHAYSGYEDEICEGLDNTCIEYSIQKEYCDKNKTIRFRSTCDIFIYAQEHDAGSNSPLEYMFLGSRIVIAERLLGNYKKMDKVGYEYYHFKEYAEIGSIISNLLETFTFRSVPMGVEGLRKIYNDENSWEVMAPQWQDLLCLKKA